MKIAHIRGEEVQTLQAHSRNVAKLASDLLEPCQLPKLGYLAGLIHDQGKATDAFENYLLIIARCKEQGQEPPSRTAPHAPAGAIYAYTRWFKNDGTPAQRRTAQIIAMVVLGHHAGLPDCLGTNGDRLSPFLDTLDMDRDSIHYEEALTNFFNEVAAESELDSLFDQACAEVEAFCAHIPADIEAFCLSMLARLVLGAVVDADCWDTACYERNADCFEVESATPWSEYLARLNKALAAFDRSSKIGAIRGQISDACRAAGQTRPSGIYRLTVPTGGGKTLSGLLFALENACHARTGTKHLMYIAPYNTILEQNADVIRGVLDNDPGILEHHADILFEDDESEDAQRHRKLTERWTSPIILTSMVQFLETLFRGRNSSARRFPHLAKSILIFDEIQALPRRCTVLFECAIRFLADCMGCTLVLCTATQPTLRAHKVDVNNVGMQPEKLNNKPELGVELVDNVAELFQQLRRVQFVDEQQVSRSNAQAAADVAAMLRADESLMLVVNTRKVAREIFAAVKKEPLPENTLCIHLSTDMCAAHRQTKLKQLREALEARKHDPDLPPVCCISTALIEAGVDISFPVVIRSLAGLPSILQAAGRCNRSMETSCGKVYIWRLKDEKLNSLVDISRGQNAGKGIIESAGRKGQPLDDPECIALYFQKELREGAIASELFYPRKDEQNDYLSKRLSNNTLGWKSVEDAKGKGNAAEFRQKLALSCSWRTVGAEFQVIEENTTAVLVPYGKEGEDIISQLSGQNTLAEERKLLRKAQRYSVNLYPNTLRRVSCHPVGETGAIALRPEYYDDELGITEEPRLMEAKIL